MENMNIKVISLIVFLLIIYSCSSYKKLLKEEGTVDDAIENVIMDYYYSNKQEIKTHDVFALEVRKIDNKMYDIIIDYQYNKEVLKSKDKVGSYSNSIPTKFKIYNNKLFTWNDATQPVNQETLNALYKYDRLDSTFVKLELGQLDSENYDPVMFRIDEMAETVYYIICRKNIAEFKKLKTHEYIKPGSDKLPEISCD